MKQKYVTFLLGDRLYGLDIMKVKGIEKVENIYIIPNMPKTIRGVFKLRNSIIPVIDLKKRFTFNEEETNIDTIVLVNTNEMELGILIDKVKMVFEVDTSEIQPPPILNTGINKDYLKGITKVDDKNVMLIIDLDKLFSKEELLSLKSHL
ncbi:MAG TPA: chemotaxis protein CheW [Exilispira sp.]|nr:chemotaxis protein CheW [Exilispira sp.]